MSVGAAPTSLGTASCAWPRDRCLLRSTGAMSGSWSTGGGGAIRGRRPGKEDENEEKEDGAPAATAGATAAAATDDDDDDEGASNGSSSLAPTLQSLPAVATSACGPCQESRSPTWTRTWSP